MEEHELAAQRGELRLHLSRVKDLGHELRTHLSRVRELETELRKGEARTVLDHSLAKLLADIHAVKMEICGRMGAIAVDPGSSG